MEVKTFTIRRNCPEKYVGENRYLTAWEKRMKKAIELQVDEEIKRKKERQNLQEERRAHVIVMELVSLDEEGYRKKRISEIERNYRRGRILNILKKAGLNIEEFLKTEMGSCARINMLLDCVQDKIDGFDYDEKGTRIPNNRKMDVKQIRAEYEEGILRIDDGTYINEFKFDEHMLIYVNGENVFKSSLISIPTNEEDNKMLQDLFDDLHSDRITHERKMQKSLEYARTWRVEE